MNTCPHCTDPDCDTDCGERAREWRDHHRRQMADIELCPEEIERFEREFE